MLFSLTKLLLWLKKNKTENFIKETEEGLANLREHMQSLSLYFNLSLIIWKHEVRSRFQYSGLQTPQKTSWTLLSLQSLNRGSNHASMIPQTSLVGLQWACLNKNILLTMPRTLLKLWQAGVWERCMPGGKKHKNSFVFLV